jgi:hypothetical protein
MNPLCGTRIFANKNLSRDGFCNFFCMMDGLKGKIGDFLGRGAFLKGNGITWVIFFFFFSKLRAKEPMELARIGLLPAWGRQLFHAVPNDQWQCAWLSAQPC